MAKANLLNTGTTNFLELIGNGRTYRVPPYQRDYSWGEAQWEDLWSDLAELRARPAASHYMGALVVEGKSDREFAIIDGQQRFATLSLLVLAVISRLLTLAAQGIETQANQERAAALRARYIGEKDPASLIESSKLALNSTDGGFYQDYLVQLRAPLNPRGLPKSNRLLWECARYFESVIAADTTLAADGLALASLISEIVGRQLMFIRITVDDELSAYTVFETLNARGLELSATDLLKNFLFSRLRTQNDLQNLQRRWLALISTVQQERFPEFLRYHLQCEVPRVRNQRLFQLVRERVRDGAGVFALMDALESRAELFAALSDAAHAYWIERPECREAIRELIVYRARQMTPLLFAGWEKFDRNDFARLLRLVGVLLFRHGVIGGRNPNALEPVFHASAKAVLDGTAIGPAGVFALLKPVYVDDERFERDFARFAVDPRGQGRKLIRYMLARLEADAARRACDPETDPGTVEHVLPENPSAEWEEAIPADKWVEATFRLGNLVLLEASANRQIASAGYAKKVAVYAGSSYMLPRQLAAEAPEEWTLAHLDARQDRMARRAVHLWRSDFA
jgi:GNAT superfamily N-acetyltransferase